jgi:hypothetical protein
MKKLMTLKTEGDERVLIHLDNWGVGTDRLYRRWTLEHDGWHCLETGEVGWRSGFMFGGISRLMPKAVGP